MVPWYSLSQLVQLVIWPRIVVWNTGDSPPAHRRTGWPPRSLQGRVWCRPPPPLPRPPSTSLPPNSAMAPPHSPPHPLLPLPPSLPLPLFSSLPLTPCLRRRPLWPLLLPPNHAADAPSPLPLHPRPRPHPHSPIPPAAHPQAAPGRDARLGSDRIGIGIGI